MVCGVEMRAESLGFYEVVFSSRCGTGQEATYPVNIIKYFYCFLHFLNGCFNSNNLMQELQGSL